jgi:hypothetical protein
MPNAQKRIRPHTISPRERGKPSRRKIVLIRVREYQEAEKEPN